jgi:hypothetical protein
MQEPEQIQLDGKIFNITKLNVVEGRKVYHRAQKLLVFLTDTSKTQGLDPIAFASMAGILSEADLDALVDAFAAKTSVELDGERTKPLAGKNGCMDEVFAGRIELMFEWLIACLELNFGGYLAKMRSALETIAAKAPAPQATESSDSQSQKD